MSKIVTFRVFTDVVLKLDDVKDMVLSECKQTGPQLVAVFKKLQEIEGESDENVILVESKTRMEPHMKKVIKKRILEEVDEDGCVECSECRKEVYPDVDGGEWDRCSSGDHYRCYKCSNPESDRENEEEEG